MIPIALVFAACSIRSRRNARLSSFAWQNNTRPSDLQSRTLVPYLSAPDISRSMNDQYCVDTIPDTSVMGSGAWDMGPHLKMALRLVRRQAMDLNRPRRCQEKNAKAPIILGLRVISTNCFMLVGRSLRMIAMTRCSSSVHLHHLRDLVAHATEQAIGFVFSAPGKVLTRSP